jgi:hypothetical protein
MSLYYPTGAIRSRNELTVGDKVYSICFPDNSCPNAIANTLNLKPYIILSIDLHQDRAVLEPNDALGQHREAIIALSYRNLDRPCDDCNGWFLFKNFWHAWAYFNSRKEPLDTK